jgi:hypothetical protein
MNGYTSYNSPKVYILDKRLPITCRIPLQLRISLSVKMKSAIAAAALFAASASAQLYDLPSNNHSCVIQPSYRSCSKKANPLFADTCCVETFGGLVLATQVSKLHSGN